MYCLGFISAWSHLLNGFSNYYNNLKNEIEKLKQTRNNYSLNQNTNNYQQPVPLGPLPRYYNW